MLKTSIATLIVALYPRYTHIQDFHVLTLLNRRCSFTYGARRCGRACAARQRELIHDALRLSTGATLRLIPLSRKQPITGYDSARSVDKSVECVFKRDPVTGVLTLLSAETVERKPHNSPWFYYDEWAWSE